MWKFSLILLIATAVLETSNCCRERIEKECRGVDEPEDMPGTAEELEEFCKFALHFFGCANDLVDECDEEETPPDFIKYIQEIHSNMNRICYKDSPLYRNLSEVIPCLKKNLFPIIKCYERFENDTIENYREELTLHGITDVGNEDDVDSECLNILYMTSCWARNTRRLCGETAMNVVIDILVGFDSPYEKCRPGIKHKLPTIVRVMELEEEMEEEIENEIKKK